MNKIILMGNLTRDPEIRYTQGENALAVARFSLAINRRLQSREIRKLIILTAPHLVSRQSLSKSISVKVHVCW